ncbi:hypothetical protein [Celeribacter baekdonensis]|uniref:hypothetical protein n=1 Tax=Celeribacter baekdonensis TaxID=875171 RepID=UPI0009F334CD|nr:hypothetical protein [Celeribacter baekdonensis]
MINQSHSALRYPGAGQATAPSQPKPEPTRAYDGGKHSKSVTSGNKNQLTYASPDMLACRSMHRMQQP